ncbi:TetR/AcrR family transcriptional regulator [Mycolicibacterium fallax]|uniref:Uncharacterized protein n=1 Tax=Mycolicibacterium fallax TaxID=1793 RepID=A0A1X1RG68_MYCFA|nr:TetR/AcrR family transcriptional regulator [Mycolicibacterium fallax]ORV05081.1 hypothetical protein AWC04_07310 [Mycolicibacterium fallax]BBY97516.1 hypothetical protein MFAL_09830 [Mycolicibacterium fallax]HSA40435.1 TetR/AcrR family transcriptional regulator [Mycobacterium sp.]
MDTGLPHTQSRLSKRLRTRAKLIDAAVKLVADHGYDNVTVEQIAGVVDVSPRTVANHFPSKDRLLLALAEEFSTTIDVEFARVPAVVPPLRALFDAHIRALELARSGAAGIEIARLLLIFQTINEVPRLRAQTLAHYLTRTSVGLAERLGVDAADRQVRLLAALWSGIVQYAWGDLRAAQVGFGTAETLDLLTARLTDVYTGMLQIAAAGD